MNTLSHLFVAASETEGKIRTKNRKIILADETTGQHVSLNKDELGFLITNWSYYAGKNSEFVENDIFAMSDDVKKLFGGLIENIRNENVTSEYVVKQNEQFGLAVQALKH